MQHADLDEKVSPKGIEVIARDIQEGVIYNENGVKITAFLVDHGAVTPAFGYRAPGARIEDEWKWGRI